MKNKILTLVLCVCCSWGATAQKVWTLQECIDHAKEHNLNIQMQSVSEQNQQIQLSSAKNRRLPDLSASLRQSYAFGRSISPVDNTYQSVNSGSSAFSVSTSVPLFTGFRISNEIAVAKLNLKAAYADLEKAKEDIELSVVSAYFQVLYNKELVGIATNQVDISKQQLERLQALFDLGKASEAQVYELKAQIANDELSLVQVNGELEISLLLLTQLLELPSPQGFDVETTFEEIDFLLPATPEQIYDNAVALRAVVRSAESRLESSKKAVGLARSGYYPQLSFSAGYNNSYSHLNGFENKSFADQIKRNEGKYFGFSLSIPIFDRFSTRNNIRSAKLSVHTNDLLLANTKKTLYKDIQQAYYNAVSARGKFDVAKTALGSSQKSYEFTREKFENGRATSYEFNEAKHMQTKALANVSQAKYDYIFRKKILDFYNSIR